jgi:hypothetical protein
MKATQDPTLTGWDNYFVSANSADLVGSFDALVTLGMRPLVIGEDPKTGKIKIPLGNDWGLASIETRRQRLEHYLAEGVPVGIGVQPDGHIVLDIDPPGKDRSKLPQAWKEAASILLGSEDWPSTLTVKTQAGCHVWFKTTDQISEQWANRGKLKLDLPSGGAVEFFTGNNKQIQVACPPSDGKQVAMACPPVTLPHSMEQVILELLNPDPVSFEPKRKTKATTSEMEWYNAKLLRLTENILNAEEGKRHDTYRASCRVMGGYAVSLGLHELKESAYIMLASAHKEAKPEVSDYVLVETFKWGWDHGVNKPLKPPEFAKEPDVLFELSDVGEAANTATIRALMKEREWLWGKPERNLGWFIQRGLHLVEGKEGTGKTRWIMDLVRRWSFNLPWPDGSDMSLDIDSKVLFVASDSHWDQIAMTSEAFGIPDENVIFTGPEADPYNYTSIDEPRTLDLIRHWCSRYKVAMVVIDTLMAASSRPLVDPQEVAKLAGPLRALARDMNVAIVLVGHLNSQGETWGRAMGRTCDNVIRMEADDRDEQSITIKSVKARWNRFELPVIRGRQGECGWEYDAVHSSDGDVRVQTKADAISQSIIAYLRQFASTEPTRSSLVEVMMEKGYAKQTVYRVIKEMTVLGQLAENHKDTFSGHDIIFYSLPT